LIKPYYMMLFFDPLFKECQLWRVLTAVFYYPITPQTGFHFLINCYFLYNYSLRLETGLFAGRPADYFFMLIFNWLLCIIVGLIGEIHVLMDPMVLSVLYIWCQLNKDTIVSFWFGTRFKAMYLPWVLFAFNLVISGGGILELVGILIGHLYFFLMFKYPQDIGGPALISTPSILKRWFPEARGGMGGFGIPPQSRAAPAQPGAAGGGGGMGGLFRGHQWGRGQQLGN